jgi:ABC-type uncharacterized transport system auxiliary subunit
MTMIPYRWWVLGLVALWLAGCGGKLLPKSKPPVYYQLDYQATPLHCGQAFQKGLRVWRFADSSTYQRTEMVVIQPQGKVAFSSAFQWVARPGSLVADNLLRDLTMSRLFPQVVSGNDPVTVPLELTGRVFVFAWERAGGTSRAVLQVEVSLIDTDEPRHVVFRREYNLRSDPLGEDTSSAFARAMSELMKKFSEEFQQDLCKTIRSLARGKINTNSKPSL